MIKTLTVLYLLGATCFSSASQTGGPSVAGRQQMLGMSNKNQQPPAMSWQSPVTPNENRQANAQLYRSQESENEINTSDNMESGDENSAATEEKVEPPPQPLHQQQPQQGPNPTPQGNQNKRPTTNQHINPTPYATIYPPGNHPPGMPITQYSGVQMMGYQKEQTGQAPIAHQQQLFYSGGSNSIPLMIYSDSERPPITMFYLGGDKQFQGALKTGDFMPNLQPMGQQMMYSQNLSPFNIPMPFYDSTPSSPVNAWDKQYPMFDTYSSPQFYSSNVILKTKESQKNDRMMSAKPFKPKSAEYSGMNFENELSIEPMGRAAIMMNNPENMNMNKMNPFIPRAMDNQWAEPWMMPQKQRQAQMANLRSVMNPFWGAEPKQSKNYEINEPMERSSSNNWDSSVLGSRYTSLPTSPYTGGYSTPASTYSATTGGQHSSLNQGAHSQLHSNTGAQNQFNLNNHNTAFVQPLPNGGQISSYTQSQKGYNAGSQGHTSLNSADKKYQSQYGAGQGSTYLTPTTSYGNAGSSYVHPGSYGHSGSGIRAAELLGAARPQQLSGHQNIQPSNPVQGVPQNKAAPIIAIVPVAVIPSDHESALSNSHLHQSQTSHPFSSGRNAVLGTSQFGLGGFGGGFGGGYGNTGLNNQYSNLHNGHLAGQSSGASNNQQFGHENVNTGFVQPLPSGGQIYTQVNSDKGFSGGNFGQGSQSLGVNDQNFNAGGLSANQGYNTGLGILPNTGVGLGVGGLGVGGLGIGGGFMG